MANSRVLSGRVLKEMLEWRSEESEMQGKIEYPLTSTVLPLQGSGIPTWQKVKKGKMEWSQRLQFWCDRMVLGVSGGSLLPVPGHRCYPKVPMSYVLFQTPPIWLGSVVFSSSFCYPTLLLQPILLLCLWSLGAEEDVGDSIWLDWMGLGSVEHWVKSAHWWRKLELVCSVANFLDYGERTQAAMGQFAWRSVGVHVTGIQIDLIPWFVVRSWSLLMSTPDFYPWKLH